MRVQEQGDEAAQGLGFSDREQMRRAFLRVLGQPPQTVRHLSRASRAPAAPAGTTRAESPAHPAPADNGRRLPAAITPARNAR
ncbi:hypothetical protein CAL28_12260 [Bordetella genomosp. 11]|uniref:Uncharacterized protein n=1 Tax=Bordetella genomosp. 11 TaxID=1416808 RepID=A0A261UE70_9BORD|nr:hypothetical protein CAL28_12260 [Bordetella genomosp. 11]